MPIEQERHNTFIVFAIFSILCNTILNLDAIPILHYLFSILPLIAVGYAFSLVLINFKVGKFTYLVFLFYVVLGATTFIHHGAFNIWTSRFINSLGLFILLYYSILRSPSNTIAILAQIFSVLIYINFFMMFIPPLGDILDGYLLGRNHNQVGAKLLCGIITSCMAYDMRIKTFKSALILCMVCVITPLYIGSTTSSVGCILASGFMLIPKDKVRRIIILTFFIFYVLFQSSVVFLGQDISTQKAAVYLVEDVMGKDLTFTYRTVVWLKAYDKIEASPITGYGMRDDEWFSGEFLVLSAHNIILQLLLYGGIVLLATLILIILITVVHSLKERSRITDTALFGLCTFFFMMMMENYNEILIFYLLFILYYSPIFSNVLKPIELNQAEESIYEKSSH